MFGINKKHVLVSLVLGLGTCTLVNASPNHSHSKIDANQNKVFAEQSMALTQKMHHDMDVKEYANDPDYVFAKGMLAHHVGAVEMSELQVKYGKNPEMLKLAKDIIKAQKAEIDFMRSWIKNYKPKK